MHSRHKVLSGLEELLAMDSYLLRIDVNERTITHRLGMYYQDLFSSWDVDCEYNRRLDKPKDVEFDIKQLLHRMSRLLRERQNTVARDLMGYFHPREYIRKELIDLEYQLSHPRLEYDPEQDLYYFLLRLINGDTVKKPVIPDIIVHKRGKKNNFIAIEAKKTSSPSIASREYDLLKLQALILDDKYAYKHGYFIDIPVLEDFNKFSKFSLIPDSIEPRVTLVLPT